ncbi:MAG: hypothetical protein WD231_02405 [Candidatus Woykebacteria bacterium]
MESLKETLKGKEETVNSLKRNSNTVNSITVTDQVNHLVSSFGLEEESVAKVLAQGLSDERSLGYYRLLANNYDPQKLYEALSFTKLAATEGRLVRKRAIYFQGILKRWGYQTKFKEGQDARP